MSRIKAIVHSIIETDDTPHRIAWGVAIGIFIAWTPTVGLQMVFAGIVAWLLGASKLPAVAIVWVSNPYTIVPIFWFNYRVGQEIFGGPTVDWLFFHHLFEMQQETNWIDFLIYAYHYLTPVFIPLWIGSIVVGFFFSIFSYFITLHFVSRIQARNGLLVSSPSARTSKPTKVAN